MAEYINKELLLHKIGQIPIAWEYGQAVKDIYDMVKNEPAADVAPVVHGRWVRPHWRNDVHCMDCSECCGEAHHQEFHGVEKYYSMCPHCGARMDGTEETDEVQK